MDDHQKPLHKRTRPGKLDNKKPEGRQSPRRAMREGRPDFNLPEAADFGGRAMDLDMTEVAKRIEKPEDLLSGDWLQSMTDEEMVFTIMAMILDLQARIRRRTKKIARVGPDILQFSILTDGLNLKLEADNFIRLPATFAERQVDESDSTWRFILLSPSLKQRLLPLEIHADIVIGRKGIGRKPPDLDLGKYCAAPDSVSRRHALLRPTPTGLSLIDLGSTNGTFYGQERLFPRDPQMVEDEGMISFADLHFKIMFVSQPGSGSD